MIRNISYYSAYYKDCDIFDKVAQTMKKMISYSDENYHIDRMLLYVHDRNKEIFNLLSIFKSTMYQYRTLWDEGTKYRDKAYKLRKEGYPVEETDAIFSQWDELGQQMDKCEDIMIQQLEKGYLMFLEINKQGHWSNALGALRGFISMCDVLGFDIRAAEKKAKEEIEKRRIEEIVDKHIEKKLSKLEKKIDKLLSKE